MLLPTSFNISGGGNKFGWFVCPSARGRNVFRIEEGTEPDFNQPINVLFMF